MADHPPDTDGSGDPILQAEVEAYVRSYLTPEELRRTSLVIDQIAASSSTKRDSDSPESTSVLVHWRRFIWATSGLSVALLVLFLVGFPAGSVRLRVLSSETRNATLPPELEIDRKKGTIRMSGSGIVLLGQFDPALSNSGFAMPILLKSADGTAAFQGTLQLTNRANVKNIIVGALLEGNLKILDVGTNDVSASFSN